MSEILLYIMGIGTGHFIYLLFIVEGYSPVLRGAAHQKEKGNLPQHMQDLFKKRHTRAGLLLLILFREKF